MKKSILMALSLVLVLSLASVSFAANLSGNIKTGGSTSVEKVMNSLIYQFQSDNKNVRIDYEMNGSGDGIKSTLSGLYEIGHSSRDLKTDGSESGLKPIVYAIDGIAVVMNKQNTVVNLTQQQLFSIYTGKTTNWKEVGGKDALITVISREPGSGTRSAFTEIVGLEAKNKPETNLVAHAIIADSTGAVQTTVMQNPNAIGYMSFSDVDTKKVKPVKYNGVEISSKTLKSDTYKLKRAFVMIVKEDTKLSQVAEAFIEFVLSEQGQAIVAQNKLLPVK
ncbi:MAG: phosphate ABC transporter substrate-binding protein [Firmicutes bacterium]|nr:phosphate ABC transporter substrate-binding protein [Bacillota bacterium]